MIRVYGIKNCDTVKKALRWLDSNDIGYEFIDYRVAGVTKDQVKTWASRLGWEKILNRRSTTWRKIDDSDKAALTESKAIALMLENPTLIKRPVIHAGRIYLLGFSHEEYKKHLAP